MQSVVLDVRDDAAIFGDNRPLAGRSGHIGFIRFRTWSRIRVDRTYAPAPVSQRIFLKASSQVTEAQRATLTSRLLTMIMNA